MGGENSSESSRSMTSYLLELPIELRNYIYELVLVLDQPIKTFPWFDRTRDAQPGLT